MTGYIFIFKDGRTVKNLNNIIMESIKLIEVSITDFLNRLKGFSDVYNIYAPVINENQKKEMVLLDDDVDLSKVELNGIRPSTNLKSFFFESHSKVADYPESKENIKIKKRILVGVKSCDIFNFDIIDKIFLDKEYPQYDDTFYKTLRENTMLITSDCDNIVETCSCKLFDINPYCQGDKNIIMNITQVEDKVILEFYSRELNPETFEADKTSSNEEELIKKRDTIRQDTVKSLEKNLNQFKTSTKDYQKILTEKQIDNKWIDIAKTCVECHGCLNGCPTCHCYLLLDAEVEKDKFERYRVWDSCYYRGYAVMAGGLTPRPDFLKRFKNRFNHKYDWFVTNHNVNACSGCGRCIETCMGKIDFREVFEKLNS